ncbi:hypothetical protein BGZ96_005618, partial [Linnemannia gamsii]
MESYPTSTAALETGEAGSNTDRSLLAVSSMVPINARDVDLSTNTDPKVQRPSPSRKRKSPPPQELPLAIRGLEGKRARLIREGVSEEAITFINNKQRIIKYVHLSRHQDLAICPVQAYTAYRSRTMSMDVPVPHPKDKTYSKRPSEPLVSSTISVYMNTISRLFVPKGTRPPKLRALGSTLAAMAGVPIPDIMVQGNWSSPKIFEKHYRLSSVVSNNLSVPT